MAPGTTWACRSERSSWTGSWNSTRNGESTIWTCRSGLSRLEVGREIAEYVIGHTATGLVRVYNKYEFLPERRDALQQWADWVREVVGPSEPGKVVALYR